MTAIIQKIVSHETPDLDSILSIYLLKKYGMHKYPGIEDAKLEFYPAGVLPEGKTGEELEREGILTVDTGGGRFDTHPVGNTVDMTKADRCASFLVAEDLEIDRRPELDAILNFTRLQDVEGRSLQSTDPLDHAFSLVNIIRGFNLMNDGFTETVKATCKVLEALVSAEAERSLVIHKEKIPVNFYQRLQITGLRKDSTARIRIARSGIEGEGSPDLLDLDTILSLYLLKNYGSLQYREFFSSPIEFELIERILSQEQISSQGLLLFGDTETVDSQDTDPNQNGYSVQQNKASAKISLTRLISDALSLKTAPELTHIVALGQSLVAKAAARERSPAIETKVDIFTILHGFNLLNGTDFRKTFRDMEPILNSIAAQDRDWYRALNQYEAGARVFKAGSKGKVKIVAVEAESGSILRVARWKDKSDLTLYRNPATGHITIITRRNGPLQNFKLGTIARLIRTAEAIEGKNKINLKMLNSPGNSAGWFLHPSEKILSKGSPKATNISPSQIPFKTLTDLVLCYFKEELKLPERYCPVELCSAEKCSFFNLALPNCHIHRERVQLKSSSLGARLSPDILEKLRKLNGSID